MWYWPCSSGKITFSLKLAYGAYTPGQLIKYTLQINNQSESDTDGYSYEFIKKTTFTVTSCRTTKRILREALAVNSFNEKCLRLTNCIFEGTFAVPKTLPTSNPTNITKYCLEYFLEVIIKIAGYHSNCKLIIPITIGTIPLRDTFGINELEDTEPTAPLLTKSNN